MAEGIYGPSERGQYFAAGRGRTIREQFEAFHAEHPEVYRELVALARLVKSRGRPHWGIKAAFEVARYTRIVERDDAEPFLLNNNYAPHYARLIMDREPDLAGFFAVRELHEPSARDVVRGAGRP